MSAPIGRRLIRKMFPSFTLKIVLFNTFLPLFSCTFATQHKSSLSATKTKYDNSYKDDKNVVDHKLHENNIEEMRSKFPELSDIPGCQPVHVNGLFRHGIRYPGTRDVKNAAILLQHVADHMDEGLYSRLKSVHTQLQGSDIEKALSKTGEEELGGLGRRFGKRFKDMFKESQVEDLTFEATSKSRAISSGKAFRSAFLNTIMKSKVVGNPALKIRDDLLRTFDNCTRYVNFVKDDPTYLFEYEEFQKNLFPVINKKISKFVGKDLYLTNAELKSVYVMAASEVAVLGSTHWADFLDLEDMVIQEYAADIKSYWKRGYGHRLSYEHVCPLLEDIFTHMDNALLGFRYQKGVFRFAHAETLLPLMTMLGLFNDSDPLRADNFMEQNQRKFRTSVISPFSGNIAFVLYYCDPDHRVKEGHSFHLNLPPSYGRYMVQLLFKEIPITFPFTNYDLVSYEEVKRYYRKFIKLCDYTEICGNSQKKNKELPHDEL